jgi:hypothetical protein
MVAPSKVTFTDADKIFLQFWGVHFELTQPFTVAPAFDSLTSVETAIVAARTRVINTDEIRQIGDFRLIIFSPFSPAEGHTAI